MVAYKEINKLKKENEKAYKKILKKIDRLQSLKIERLKKLRDISKIELNNGDGYLYALDAEKSIVFMINDNKIYIIDYIVMVNEDVDSVLIKNYESKQNKETVERKNKTS